MTFRLEKLLSLRQKEEEAIKLELNRVRARIREIEALIEEATVSKNETEKELRIGVQTGAQLGFLVYIVDMYQNYIAQLNAKMSKLREEEEDILRQYLEKRTERKSFEKLKERFVVNQQKEEDRRDRKIIDEVALQKYTQQTEERGKI
ncbi:MAG TPA: flagellar export protein FliJ [Fervidobacterium sp.]|nr:flagellar export protein FliJ [Fervidobacterium sp.]HOK87415.1 flagellar export protein FliJ [Fervidobacterium sp.]HOM73579.1 flagellar export protein FliJ [Fervidobacterium sp.]HOQ39093.1 flagellar export protein FliJ [Fervidobacterium sp.]HPP17467.1 flagellar export protein FliJ [Fervidobacterium sp.]